MAVVVALLVVLAAQVGFWALLSAQVFLGALVANTVFWCLAFPAWTMAGRRWWPTSAAPDITLCLTMLLLIAACFYVGADPFSTGPCSHPPDLQAERACRDTAPLRDAFLWVGLFSVPVALIAAALATLRSRALRVVTGGDSASADGAPGPKPATALAIAAVVLALALAGFAVMIVANVGPPG